MPTKTADLVIVGFSLLDFQSWSEVGCRLYQNENIRIIIENCTEMKFYSIRILKSKWKARNIFVNKYNSYWIYAMSCFKLRRLDSFVNNTSINLTVIKLTSQLDYYFWWHLEWWCGKDFYFTSIWRLRPFIATQSLQLLTISV